MTLTTDLAALEEPCPWCGVVWAAHPIDDKGEHYCIDAMVRIRHVHPESKICDYRVYENWMRVMENPEEAVP